MSKYHVEVPCRRLAQVLLVLAAVTGFGALLPAHATFIGDLVYCDLDADGVYEPGAGEYGINGVDVRVTCVADNGVTCYDANAPTGMDPSGVTDIDLFPAFCSGVLTWNATTEGAQPGRYLHEVFASCVGQPGPWICSVIVDSTTLPDDCDQLVTPQAGGPPADDGGGTYCTAGPFPEGQPLGNAPAWGGCALFPDPAPGDATFTVEVQVGNDACNIHNDFGYTPAPSGGDGCTPGYWKNHLDSWGATGLNPGDDFDTTFGVDYFDPDITLFVAVNLGGGGRKKVARHGTAGLLNCSHPDVAYPVSCAEVIAAVQDGSVNDLAGLNELSDTCPVEE